MAVNPQRGKRASAQRAPTMEDVARAADVSRALVSLVMRESPNVSMERRQRVLEAAARLGYRPNRMARSLASRRTHTLGVLLDDLLNPFFAEVAASIEEAASSVGYQVVLSTGGRRAARERLAIESLLEYRVDGIIVVSPRLASADIVRSAGHVPVVMVGRRIRSTLLDFVMGDDALGGRLAVQHLLDLGHERIFHVDGGAGAGGPVRRRAYLDTMREAGHGAKAAVVAGEFTEEAGVAAAQQLLERSNLPTAVFAANDMIAAGMLHCFEESGVEVPEDVSIVGYDNTLLAGLHRISLTTIDQAQVEMGRTAVKLLLERIDGRRDQRVHLTEPTLVVRRTSGPPR